MPTRRARSLGLSAVLSGVNRVTVAYTVGTENAVSFRSTRAGYKRWRCFKSGPVTQVGEDHKDVEADSSPVTTGNRDQIPRR
jgi:hypothetical protein